MKHTYDKDGEDEADGRVARDHFPAHMRRWEKGLTLAFLSLAVVASALGVFQCITQLTRIYFRVVASPLRDLDLGWFLLALATFTCWSIASARLFSEFVTAYLIAPLIRLNDKS